MTATSVTDWFVGVLYGGYLLMVGVAAVFRNPRWDGNREP